MVDTCVTKNKSTYVKKVSGELSGYLTYGNSLYRKNSGKQTEGRQEITLASRWEGFSGTCAW